MINSTHSELILILPSYESLQNRVMAIDYSMSTHTRYFFRILFMLKKHLMHYANFVYSNAWFLGDETLEKYLMDNNTIPLFYSCN